MWTDFQGPWGTPHLSLIPVQPSEGNGDAAASCKAWGGAVPCCSLTCLVKGKLTPNKPCHGILEQKRQKQSPRCPALRQLVTVIEGFTWRLCGVRKTYHQKLVTILWHDGLREDFRCPF